jgi:pyruvate,orthophosphate dikinase
VLPDPLSPAAPRLGQAKLIRETAAEVVAALGASVDFKVGTMIEIPRGALRAGDLAKTAEFFSFGGAREGGPACC